MAIKKNELYSSLWASCDKLRGGMDASQYKDYILTLLFVKYVTDKFKGEKYADITVPEGGSFDDLVAVKNDPNIGEKMDKIIAKLAEAGDNNLTGVITNAHFNDESKLGKGQEMVDKLTGLIGIFQRPEFDFKNNKATGDDILGDAYEYLMRNFATESGKSKGQFYTPAEVSRILAKVIGIDKVTDPDTSVYDPACGSGSLLIRAAAEAPIEVAIYGQEKEITTAGLAKMNLVLHNKATGEIYAGNTFSDPHYRDDKDNSILRRFDFAVANPPFSLKNWTDGLVDYGRFTGYGDTPPEKNGDFAWLMHILKSLKSTGKAAVILPHGVLFRGNAEATIRKAIIDKGYIKGIIGLPANLFYGTGIPACIIVIDKSDADEREGIFMIDASHDYIKDGNKNRLREQDIYKIVTTFNEQIIDDPKYARFVPNDEIKIKNDYNLNIPRYIDSSKPEDWQDIEAHLHGGIPAVDVNSMDKYWALFPSLKEKLFSPLREGYYKLNIDKDEVRSTVYCDAEFAAYSERIDMAFDAWINDVDEGLRNINEFVSIKEYIVELSEILVGKYADIELVDKYDVYQVLLSYWQEVMADDVFVITQDGYEAGRETEDIFEVSEDKKTKKEKKKYKGWEGKLIPKAFIEAKYFGEAREKINAAIEITEARQSRADEIIEEYAVEDGILFDCLNAKDQVDLKLVKAQIKSLKADGTTEGEVYQILCEYATLCDKIKEFNKLVKDLELVLDEQCRAKYTELTIDEIKELLVNRKWYYSIFKGIEALYVTTSHEIAGRVSELAERYEYTLEEIENKFQFYNIRVNEHLKSLYNSNKITRCDMLDEIVTGKVRLPGFTGEWVDCRIGDMGKFYSGLTGKSKKDFECGEARFITFLNVLSNIKIDTSILASVDVKQNENQNAVKKGDLFFNTSSETPEEVGMCAVLDDELENTYLNSFCFGFRLLDDSHSPLFLSYYLNSSIGRKIMSVLAQGATRYNLSKNNFAETIIKLPAKEEQIAIASILSDMDNEIEALEQKLEKTRQIKQGMMQQLLTGKIRLV